MAGGGVERLSRLSDPEVANSILAHIQVRRIWEEKCGRGVAVLDASSEVRVIDLYCLEALVNDADLGRGVLSDSSRVSRLLSSERPAFPRLHGHEQVAYVPIDPVGNHDLDVARRLAVHRFHDPPMGYIPFIGDERTEA